jgi:hypothetical protein
MTYVCAGFLHRWITGIIGTIRVFIGGLGLRTRLIDGFIGRRDHR